MQLGHVLLNNMLLPQMLLNQIKFTFTDISMEEANAILDGLQELPAKICNPLTQKLQAQAKSQLPQPPEGAEAVQQT